MTLRDGAVQGQDLGSGILVGPFQLSIFCRSVNKIALLLKAGVISKVDQVDQDLAQNSFESLQRQNVHKRSLSNTYIYVYQITTVTL